MAMASEVVNNLVSGKCSNPQDDGCAPTIEGGGDFAKGKIDPLVFLDLFERLSSAGTDSIQLQILVNQFVSGRLLVVQVQGWRRRRCLLRNFCRQ